MLRLPRLILITALALPVVAAAQAVPKYSVVFDAQELELAVKLCLVHAHTRVTFAADSKWSMRFIHDARRGEDGTLDSGDGEWTADHWRAGECLSYRADLGAITAQHDSDVGLRLGDDLVRGDDAIHEAELQRARRVDRTAAPTGERTGRARGCIRPPAAPCAG